MGDTIEDGYESLAPQNDDGYDAWCDLGEVLYVLEHLVGAWEDRGLPDTRGRNIKALHPLDPLNTGYWELARQLLIKHTDALAAEHGRRREKQP